MKVSSQMLEDAAPIIESICLDLGLQYGSGWDRCLYLYERHGGELPYFNTLPSDTWGRLVFTEDREGYVEISHTLRGTQRTGTCFHELAHRMCICSQRFEEYNNPRMADYDWRTFQELIARGVQYIYHGLNGEKSNCLRYFS